MIRCSDIAEAARILAERDNVLILTHVKPDGDATGSTLALRELMRDNGRTADALFPESVPKKFLGLAGDRFRTALAPEELARYRELILLDCAIDERSGLGPLLTFPPAGMPVLNIDHHEKNHVTADWSYVQGDAAATCEIILAMAEELKWRITPRAATFLLLGIITDTGAFRFQNTTPATLRAAAKLREIGADWDAVINAAFFSKSRSQLDFEAEMLSHRVQSACDGRYLYAILPQEMFDRHHFSMKDGESLIDLLREVEGVAVAALIYPHGEDIKISLRSKDPRYPVGPVAAKFGGGGHRMAAGSNMPGCATLEEAAARLNGEILRLLET